MSSMYANYIRERSNDIVLETSEGFAQYRYLNEKQVFIVDLYIVPEARRMRCATALVNDIVDRSKMSGHTELLANVWVNAKNSQESLMACLAYGFKMVKAEGDLILLRKDI